MFHQNYQAYGQSSYQSGPPPTATATQHNLPPLHIQPQSNMQHQQYFSGPPPASPARSTMIPPPSPSISTESPEDEDRIRKDTPGPSPISHRWDGKIWALKMAQEPLKARMCGFGDKDRRPVSSPPVVRLLVFDESSMEEIDYQNNKLELSHLVCTVDIFDRWGRSEKNIVKHSQSSPCISAATSGPFPTTPLERAPPQNHQPLDKSDPKYTAIYGQQQPATSPYHTSTQQSYSNGTYQSNTNTPYTPDGNYAQYPPPYARSTAYNAPSQFSSHTGPVPTPYDSRALPPMNTNLAPMQGDQAQQSQWTRNLIGSLCTSAALLHDESGQWGIWFVFQDLSVRTEDWFRLKFNFFNVGKSTADAMRANGSNGTVPQIRANDVSESAPALASVFSAPFKVYSAKKFPGVADSTPLSKCFAGQGMKISIRKDPTGKRDRDEAGIDGDNEDEDDDNGEN